MLCSPFDNEIGFASVKADDAALSQLLPEETAWVKKLKSISRRSEFAAGRVASRQAAGTLGLKLSKAILPSKERYPLWLDPVIGCISHSHGITAAAIAPKARFRSLGLDMELMQRSVDYKLESRILLGEEREWVSSEPARSQERLIRIFSAKECIYKALFPLTGIQLTYRDILCVLNGNENSFECTISKNLGTKFSDIKKITVSSISSEGFVLSGLVLCN